MFDFLQSLGPRYVRPDFLLKPKQKANPIKSTVERVSTKEPSLTPAESHTCSNGIGEAKRALAVYKPVAEVPTIAREHQQLGIGGSTTSSAPSLIRHYPHQCVPQIVSLGGIDALGEPMSKTELKIAFGGPRMKGIGCTFQQWSITPLSSNQYWQPNDVIKIMANISQGLIDPYRTHIQYTVQVFPQWQPVGGIQIDNSAQSIISQTVLLSNQAQVERIQQYDTLAAALTDLGFSQYVCMARSGQGLGYNNVSNAAPACLAKGSNSTILNALSQLPLANPLQQYNTGGGFSPVIAPQFTGAGYATALDSGNQSTTAAGYVNTIFSGLSGGSLQSSTNWLAYPQQGVNYATSGNGPSLYCSAMGRAMSVRSQYLLMPQMNGYPDGPLTYPLTAPAVQNQNWTYTTMTSQGYGASRPYQTTYGVTPPSVNNYSSVKPQPCGVTGYMKPVSPEFSLGTNQPMISATIPQCQMMNGLLLPQPVPITMKTFRIPLISAILGVLIPPDQFQLIPAEALKNFILQITLNPFAFFTTGYSDVHEFDAIGSLPTNMQQRKWQISSFEWVWHLYTFQSGQIQQMIKDKLYQGISISSNLWSLSAQYQLPNGSYVRNTFQIPVNVDSLAEVMILFLSNEYQTKSFCRKQFRLSNNITSMQLKANGQWYPLQPIIGNSGNPQAVDTTGDNWDFYQLLLLSNNFMFNTNNPLPKINQKNFSINGRCYNSSQTGPLLANSVYNQGGSVSSLGGYMGSLNNINPTTVNCHTAMGQSWFHQNRFVGKALYCYSFQPYGHSKGLINGLNTRNFRQFDVIFNNSPLNVFPTDQTLLIFTRANVVVKFSATGIEVIGV